MYFVGLLSVMVRASTIIETSRRALCSTDLFPVSVSCLFFFFL